MCAPASRARSSPSSASRPAPCSGLLLVTSTQFGQQALDGLPGTHSPFATALFAALEASPGIYFEQVLNEVARATYEAAQKQRGFLQIPGRVVGGEAPADCLAGKGCVGDTRMAALAKENEKLAADAAGVRNLLDREEARARQGPIRRRSAPSASPSWRRRWPASPPAPTRCGRRRAG